MKPNMRWFFFSISGRISRLPYFLGFVFLNFVSVVVLWPGLMAVENGTPSEFWGFVSSVYLFAALWIIIATSIKRLHDLNFTGWAVLLLFVPFLGFLLLLSLNVIPGNAGPNSYGNALNRPKD